ncbi:MAG TPA: hypothetical protein PK500_07375 [Candidatus Egerieousia sp.]|nr:hypothetical protein [Candidatus Egerieousia sp.]
MKMRYLAIIATAIALAFPATAGAQNATVRVDKNYEGDLTSAGKPKMALNFADTLRNFNLNFDYHIFDKPFRDLYEFSPLPTAQIHSPMQADYPWIIAKLGISIPFSPVATVYIQPNIFKNNTENVSNSLRFKFEHKSYWGKVPLAGFKENGKTTDLNTKAQANSWNTGGSINYDHQWLKGNLSAEAYYRNVHDSYYGYNSQRFTGYANAPDINHFGNKSFMKNDMSHQYNQGGVNLNISSIDNAIYTGKFRYDLNLAYSNTSDKAKIATLSSLAGSSTPLVQKPNIYENWLKLNGEAGPTFGKYSMVTIGVNSESVFYTGIQDYHYSLLEGTLQYKFNNGRWKFNLGARTSISFKNKDGANKYFTYISPKATVSYELIDNKLWAYGIADGGNDVNSYSSMLRKNRWIAPIIDMRASSVPLIAKAGLKGMANDKISYDIYAGYAIRKGMLQYVEYEQLMNNAHYPVGSTMATDYSNSIFNALYSSHREFMIGGQTDYKYERVKAGLQFSLSEYTKGKKYSDMQNMVNGTVTWINKEEPSGYAPFELNTYAEYNFRERIYIGATVYYRSATPYILGRMSGDGNGNYTLKFTGAKISDFIDAGVYGQYVINKHFTAFAQLNNLFNSNVQYYGMYIEKTISGGLGVLVKF